MLSGVLDELDAPAKLNVAVQAASGEARKVLHEVGGKFVTVALDPESGCMAYAANTQSDVVVRMLREAADAIETGRISPVPFIPFVSKQTAGG